MSGEFSWLSRLCICFSTQSDTHCGTSPRARIYMHSVTLILWSSIKSIGPIKVHDQQQLDLKHLSLHALFDHLVHAATMCDVFALFLLNKRTIMTSQPAGLYFECPWDHAAHSTAFHIIAGLCYENHFAGTWKCKCSDLWMRTSCVIQSGKDWRTIFRVCSGAFGGKEHVHSFGNTYFSLNVTMCKKKKGWRCSAVDICSSSLLLPCNFRPQKLLLMTLITWLCVMFLTFESNMNMYMYLNKCTPFPKVLVLHSGAYILQTVVI